MAEFPFVEWLSRRYLEKGKTSRCWSDYLKAHGLANYCVARDPRHQRYELVYEIEKSWYNGNHPLTYSQHTDLTMKHKTTLSNYRETISEEFSYMEGNERNLHSLDVFGARNLNALIEFSNDVFRASKMCSEGFIEVMQEIMLSCVEVLEHSGIVTPCHYEVIAFGSVAKGEATPYSDLEYAFIVEREDEYFTKLAVDSYFRIGNLGETPLGCFDIDEVKACSPPLPGLQTDGYKIDGIKPKAGNIPTGRKGGHSLTLTVDGFMELYERAELAPFEGMTDISDMLSSSVLVYSHQTKDDLLYEELHERIMEYEQSTRREKVRVNRRRLQSFVHDIESYNFLPEQSVTGMAETEDIRVKVHIFRYPTLLANNFRLCMSFGPSPPWTTFDRLQEAGLLSPTNCKYLQIALALSIYIRTKAYITMGTMCKSVSLLPSSVKHDSNTYHVPQNLLVVLGCLTVPIKHSIRSKFRQCFELVSRAGDMQRIAKDLSECIRVDETDFMLKVELLFFLGAFKNALVELDKGVGGSFVNFSCVEFIEIIQRTYQPKRSLEYKFVRLCALTLKCTGYFSTAIDYFSWLIGSYGRGPIEIARYKSIIAECMIQIQKWKPANHLLKQTITTYKEVLGLDVSQDILEYLDSTIRSGRSLSDREKDIYPLVVEAFIHLGDANTGMYKYDEAIQTLHYSLSICSLLLHISTGWRTEIPKQKSIDAHISANDIHNCSSYARQQLRYVSNIYNSLYSVYTAMDNLPTATEYASKALTTTTSLYGAHTNHENIAAALSNVGSCYATAGDLSSSLEYYERALAMLKDLHGAKTNDRSIADVYNNIGGCYATAGDLSSSLEYYEHALAMLKASHGANTDHPSIAKVYNNIGSNYYNMCELMTALSYHLKAFYMYKALGNYLDMMSTGHVTAKVALEVGDYTTALDVLKTVHGADALHPSIAKAYDVIGSNKYRVGELMDASFYLLKASDMYEALNSSDSNNSDRMTTYYLTSKVALELGEYSTALRHSFKVLSIQKQEHGESANRCDVADSLHRVSLAYIGLADHNGSLTYLMKELAMLKALFGADSNHPDIATCYLLIGQAYRGLCNYRTALEYSIRSLEVNKAHGVHEPMEVFHEMGICCTRLRHWKEAWLLLYPALCGCQLLPKSYLDMLARIHLSISELLLSLGNISQSLEHSQKALDLTTRLLADESKLGQKFARLNAEARVLVDSLQLIKLVSYQFVELQF